MKSHRVLLMLGSSRASERGLLRGIARYSQFHGPWVFYREAPFYRKPPYHELPGKAGSPAPLDKGTADGVVAFAATQLDRQMKGQRASIQEIYLRPLYVHTRQSTDVLAVEDRVVAESLRFIRAHAGDVLSVQDVVRAVSTSRRLLERHFCQTVGASIHREIQRSRIERACRMLVETTWSVSEVAQRCGFSNAVHLSVAFKRAMQVTPQQHRRAAVAGDAGRDCAFSRQRVADSSGGDRGCVAKSKMNVAKSNRSGIQKE